MTASYKLANQKILQKTTDMEEDIFYLRLRTFKAPCILISGLDKLQIHKGINHSETEKHYVNIVHSLFKLLNIPISWILSIDNHLESTNPKCIPPEVLVTLITDNLKLFVYKTLTNYIKETNQKRIFFKLLTH
jgi:hypothetical protein